VTHAAARIGEQEPASRLAAAAEEFMRAREAFEADGADAPVTHITYYRLRDLALSTVDLCRELLRLHGADVDDHAASVLEGMRAIVGQDRQVLDALETLAGLRNAHVFAFMSAPPESVIAAGRAASLAVGAFLDGFLGDTYAVRGP